MTVSVKAIQTAFEPAKEITDPKKFAGRRAQIERGCELLISRDHVFIYGIRGIGKSSLAHQLNLIATGDSRLLQEIHSPYANEKFDYITCFLTSEDSISNINTLIYRLMRDQQGLAQWNSVFNLSDVGEYNLEGNLNASLVSEFNNRATKLSSGAKDGLLIFIDEFDRIKDQDGFASLVKSSPKNCIFVVTGIGSTEKELVKDHLSIIRKLDTGKLYVPNMAPDELKIIIERAEKEVNGEITFASEVTDELVKLAQGQPYLLQLIGKFCLIVAHRLSSSIVSLEVLKAALKEIANQKASFLEEQYLKAIKNSFYRETVLRIFSTTESDPVTTTEAYKRAKELDVANPSRWVGDLVKEQFGAPLAKVADQFYRIPDPLFKAYVAATQPRLFVRSHEDDDDITETVQITDTRNITRIVHMSDLHFGTTHYFSQLHLSKDRIPASDKPSLAKYTVESLVSGARKFKPDVLVISGDFTQSALTEEFSEAFSALSSIATQAGIPQQRIVTSIGNHDVNWAIRQADPGSKLLAFMPYLRFHESLTGMALSGTEPERLFRVYDYIQEHACVVLSLNSSILENNEDHRGYIGESQVGLALGEVRKVVGSRKLLKIAVFHHHLISVSSIEEDYRQPDQPMRDAAFIQKSLLDAGFSLVLHGHRHHGHEQLVGNHKKQLLVVGCGSSGVFQGERGSQPLQYNQIQISRDSEDQVLITIQRMLFDAEKRKWSPSDEHRPQYKVSL